MENERRKAAVEALTKLRASRNMPDILLNEFTNDHRTNQQMTGGAMLRLLHDIGELYGGPDRSRYFDPRNDQLGKICFEINTFMENHRHDMWFKLPLI